MGRSAFSVHGTCRWPPKGWTEMDPLGTLIVSLGALIVLDLAALQLGSPRRPRTRTRATRSR
jgi:hypothetical protein